MRFCNDFVIFTYWLKTSIGNHVCPYEVDIWIHERYTIQYKITYACTMDMFISGKYCSKGCKRFKLIEEHLPIRLIYIELIVYTIKFNLKVISTEIFISIFRFVHTKTFNNVIVIADNSTCKVSLPTVRGVFCQHARKTRRAMAQPDLSVSFNTPWPILDLKHVLPISYLIFINSLFWCFNYCLGSIVSTVFLFILYLLIF